MSTQCKDNLGNTYNSIAEMAKAHDISVFLLHSRLSRGWSVEKALSREHKDRVDHTGRQFGSVKEMCEHWNINPATYIKRIERGWSIEKALTTPTENINKIVAPNGVEYKCLADACKDYGISSSTVNSRLAAGKSLEEALTTPVQEQKHKSVHGYESTDHLGNKYESFSAMCRAYDINICTVNTRLERGWSLEKALTIKPRKKEDN